MKSKIIIDDFEKLHTEIRKQREENKVNLDNDNIEICLITSIYNACNYLFNNKFSVALNLVQKLAPKYHNDPITVSEWINKKVKNYTGIEETIKPIEARYNFEELVYKELCKNYPCIVGAGFTSGIDPDSEELDRILGHTINIFGMSDNYYYIFENGKNSVLVNMMIQNVIDKFDLSGIEEFINKFKIEKSLKIANDICWNYMVSINYVKKYKEKYTVIHENLFKEIDAPLIYVLNENIFNNINKLNDINYSKGYLHKLRLGDSMIDTNIRNFSEENSEELILKMTKYFQNKIKNRTKQDKRLKEIR